MKSSHNQFKIIMDQSRALDLKNQNPNPHNAAQILQRTIINGDAGQEGGWPTPKALDTGSALDHGGRTDFRPSGRGRRERLCSQQQETAMAKAELDKKYVVVEVKIVGTIVVNDINIEGAGKAKWNPGDADDANDATSSALLGVPRYALLLLVCKSTLSRSLSRAKENIGVHM